MHSGPREHTRVEVDPQFLGVNVMQALPQECPRCHKQAMSLWLPEGWCADCTLLTHAETVSALRQRAEAAEASEDALRRALDAVVAAADERLDGSFSTLARIAQQVVKAVNPGRAALARPRTAHDEVAAARRAICDYLLAERQDDGERRWWLVEDINCARFVRLVERLEKAESEGEGGI